MKKLLIISLLFMNGNYANSQVNLIPNPSFEIHDSCPTWLGQIRASKYWVGLNITPDFFHYCGSASVRIPNSIAGFQEPVSFCDSSYAGIYTSTINDLSHEVIGTKLSSDLESGRKYFVSYKSTASYQSNPLAPANCFTNGFGFKLFTFEMSNAINSTYLINDTSTFAEDDVLRDTLNWIRTFTSFIADSAYKFIVFGNFYHKPNYQYDCPNMQAQSYRFVDDFCLSVDSAFCFNYRKICSSGTDNYIFNVYPNPAFQLFQINLGNGLIGEKIFVFDTIGRKIAEYILSSNIMVFDCSHWARGIYLLKVSNICFKLLLI